MSSIQSGPVPGGLSPRPGNTLSDPQYSNYVKKQSLSACESLDAGLTIQTKEGDVVTLTSNARSTVDAFLYDGRGVMQTGSGKALLTQHQREITLTSQESFSFSVVGELSEQELADIEGIVKGMDKIISKMARGDMDGALDKALSMGGYDTVSMYTAEVAYQKSYEMTSETRAETLGDMPGPDKNRESIDSLIEKMAETFENYEEKLVAKAQSPIDKLFRHHLRDLRKTKGSDAPLRDAVETAQKQVAGLIDQMAGNMFKDRFSEFFV